MNTRRSRLLVVALYLGAMVTHSWLMRWKPPGELGMFLFHQSAASFDWMASRVTCMLLIGKLCDHMQLLCMASIIGNGIGWVLYLAYYPPSLYNLFMYGVTIAQLLRLCIGDDNPIGRLRHLLVLRLGVGRLRSL